MDAYSKFAEIYDLLMEDVPYDDIANIIDDKIKNENIKNNLVLDLACGTGTLTCKLAEKGYEMIGADASFEMLQLAREKNPDILFLNQSMEDFELYGTVGAIVSTLDSVNYLPDIKSLRKVFKNCNNYLEPGGILIFDINTEYKFKNVLANNIFTFDNEKVFYIWENNYIKEERLCDFYLTFFVKEEENYNRFDEIHTEHAFSDSEITEALKINGFDIIEKLDNFTDKKAHENSERIMYICRLADSIQAKHIQGEEK